MASDLSFVEFCADQMSGAGEVTFKKMFGEYAIYYDSKVLAVVCDNQFFLRPTAAGRELLDCVIEAPPYPGAKPHYLITNELENRELMAEVVRQTAAELPVPKPKKPKAKPAK